MTSSVLTLRQERVLHMLARFRFLTRAQIEAFLFPPEADITPGSRTVMAKRVLSSLRDRGLAGHTARGVGGLHGGSSAAIWFLTAKGARATNRTHGLGPRRRAPRGGFLAAHATTLADVALAFQMGAHEHPGHQLLEFLCDWEVRETMGNSSVIPDGFLLYAAGNLELSAFVEVDLGTEGAKFFSRKIAGYLDLWRSRTWEKTYSVWPAVLIVAPTDVRARLLKAATERVLASRSDEDSAATEFNFTSLEAIRQRGPLAPIWIMSGREGLHRLFTQAHEVA